MARRQLVGRKEVELTNSSLANPNVRSGQKTLFQISKTRLLSFSCLFFDFPSPFTGRMALLAGLPIPSALIGTAKRDRGGARIINTEPSSAATDRFQRRPSPLPVTPPLASPSLYHRRRHRHGHCTSHMVTLAAAGGGCGQQGQQQQQQLLTFQQRLAAAQAAKKKRPPLPARLLSSFLATSTVPYR